MSPDDARRRGRPNRPLHCRTAPDSGPRRTACSTCHTHASAAVFLLSSKEMRPWECTHRRFGAGGNEPSSTQRSRPPTRGFVPWTQARHPSSSMSCAGTSASAGTAPSTGRGSSASSCILTAASGARSTWPHCARWTRAGTCGPIATGWHARRARCTPHLRASTATRARGRAYSSAGPYYGGYQMDPAFERRYGGTYMPLWGDALNWPAPMQTAAAWRATREVGYSAWPASSAACGLG